MRQARVHIKVIKAAFGTTRVADVKPSDVKRGTTKLAGDYAPSTFVVGRDLTAMGVEDMAELNITLGP